MPGKREALEARKKAHPKLWKTVEALRTAYMGAVALNRGAPFSIRTKVDEGRLEVDLAKADALIRLEGIELPKGVSFSTNQAFFGAVYDRRIERARRCAGRPIQGSEASDPQQTARFLGESINIEIFESLELQPEDWISVDSEGIFLGITRSDPASVQHAVERLRALVRHNSKYPTWTRAGQEPAAPRIRITGRLPKPAELKRWPNWRHCLDEEDQEKQDESTLRPDSEQSVIGEETTLTACLLAILEPRRKMELELMGDTWRPVPWGETEGGLPAHLRHLPATCRSVLSLANDGPINFELHPSGRITRM